MRPSNLYLILITINLLIKPGISNGEADTNSSNNGQFINLFAVKTADCNFCGMTFFGALSFKVRVNTFWILIWKKFITKQI